MAAPFKRNRKIINPRTGKVAVKKSRVHYGKVRHGGGRFETVTLFADRTASQTRLNDLQRAADLQQVGIVNPFEQHEQKLLTAHLSDFKASLLAAGCPKHAKQTAAQIGRILAGCKFGRIADVSASRLASWLADRRKDGLSKATSNAYLVAFKSFLNWLLKDRRIRENPVTYLSRENAKTDVRRERRALSPDELSRLIAAAEAGKRLRRLTGPDRAALYSTGCLTGLRASELHSLTPASFDFTGDPPTVTVEACNSKRRRRDILPLHPDLLARLTRWLAVARHGWPADALLWPGTWYQQAAMILRKDLEAAGIPYLDDAGCAFDFHATRHQFCSDMARAKIHPKIAQELARHSSVELTLGRYSHVGVIDVAAALGTLPAIPAPAVAQQLQATGTSGTSSGTTPVMLDTIPMTTVDNAVVPFALHARENSSGKTALSRENEHPKTGAAGTGNKIRQIPSLPPESRNECAGNELRDNDSAVSPPVAPLTPSTSPYVAVQREKFRELTPDEQAEFIRLEIIPWLANARRLTIADADAPSNSPSPCDSVEPACVI